MALLFLDGCDLYDNGDDSELDFRWAYNSSNQVAPDVDAGRFGGGAIFLNESGEGRISTSFVPAATIIVGAALWLGNATPNAADEPIVELFDSGGTLQIYVTYLGNNALLRAYRGDGALLAASDTAWPLQTWRLIVRSASVLAATGAWAAGSRPRSYPAAPSPDAFSALMAWSGTMTRRDGSRPRRDPSLQSRDPHWGEGRTTGRARTAGTLLPRQQQISRQALKT